MRKAHILYYFLPEQYCLSSSIDHFYKISCFMVKTIDLFNDHTIWNEHFNNFLVKSNCISLHKVKVVRVMNKQKRRTFHTWLKWRLNQPDVGSRWRSATTTATTTVGVPGPVSSYNWGPASSARSVINIDTTAAVVIVEVISHSK